MTLNVAVIILNYNGEKFLEQFLPGILAHSVSDAALKVDIFVADNASTDNSVKILNEKFPQVKILALPANEGYAGGYNNALSRVQADYLVLLNSDVEVTPGWIMPVVQWMDGDKSIAACQPKIKSFQDKRYFEYAGAAGGFIDRFGYPFCRGRIFETLEEDRGQYEQAKEIFWASGACLFLRAAAFHECGGFDKAFFAHMEEIDLCWRMKSRGYKIFYCPGSTVYHVGGGTLGKANPHKTFLNFRNNLLMLKKNLSASEYRKIMRTRIFLDAVAAMKDLLTLKPGNFVSILKAHYHLRKMNEKKESLVQNEKEISGVFNSSIVWQYYVKGKKTYQELDSGKFTK